MRLTVAPTVESTSGKGHGQEDEDDSCAEKDDTKDIEGLDEAPDARAEGSLLDLDRWGVAESLRLAFSPYERENQRQDSTWNKDREHAVCRLFRTMIIAGKKKKDVHPHRQPLRSRMPT